jgi:hypothetical protein
LSPAPLGRRRIDRGGAARSWHAAHENRIELCGPASRDEGWSREHCEEVSRTRTAGQNDAPCTGEGNREPGVECDRRGRRRSGSHGRYAERGQQHGPPAGSRSDTPSHTRLSECHVNGTRRRHGRRPISEREARRHRRPALTARFHSPRRRVPPRAALLPS